MAKEQPWEKYGMKKADWLVAEVAKAVNAGYEWDCETVDLNDPKFSCFEPGVRGNMENKEYCKCCMMINEGILTHLKNYRFN